MILRPSHPLCRKIKSGPLSSAPICENVYADWSARLFTVDRTQYILLTHTTSLYSTLIYGRGITDDNQFIRAALNAIRDELTDDGLALIYANSIAPVSGMVRFCKAFNRSVVGSMNELQYTAEHFLLTHRMAPADVGGRLNDTLLSAIGTRETDGYGRPREAFRRLTPG